MFITGEPFDAGPAITGLLALPVTTSLLSLPAQTRFVVVRPQDALAICGTSVLEGLVLHFTPPSDGGLVMAGRFPVSAKYLPPEGTVVATLNASLVALDGSVTLTEASPHAVGTFDLQMSGASGGGLVQGSFDAVPCRAP